VLRDDVGIPLFVINIRSKRKMFDFLLHHVYTVFI
jgi:hypothetical protein